MATLSSRIHDLTAVIVAALNARASQAPASGYDIAKVNGYAGTQAQWLADFSDPGNTDYAGQLNALLAPVQNAGAANETQSGVTQLATLAEASAGTNALHALSALRHSNVHVASSLADLNTRGLTLPSGSIMGLPYQDFTANNAGYIDPSFWAVNNGKIICLTPLSATTAAALTYLTSVCGVGKTYANIYFEPGRTNALVQNGTPARDEYLYLGTTTGFYLWRGIAPAPSFPSGFVDTSQSSVIVDGNEASINFGVKKSDGSALPTYSTMLTLPAVANPVFERVFGGGVTIGNNGWFLANFTIQQGGGILMLAVQTTGSFGQAEGAITYRRAIPVS